MGSSLSAALLELHYPSLQTGLGLADHGMRLQVPLVVDPLVPTKEPKESTTMTPAAIIYHRRVQVLDHAGQTSVTEAGRTFGSSRTTSDRRPLGRPRPALRAGGAAAQGPPAAGDADRHPTRAGRGGAGRGGRPADPGRPPPGRPPRRPWGAPVAIGRAEAPAAAPARPTGPAGGRLGPAHRGQHRDPHQGREGRPVRVLPLRRPPG
jgi:hypothetical protein